MSEFKEKDIATFLAKTTGLARIGTYEQMKEKLRAAGYGIDMTPAYGVNLILDDELNFYAYELVDALPLVGVPGFFYITPDGTMTIWEESQKGYITVGQMIPIDEELDETSPNPVMNKVITKALMGKGPFETSNFSLDSEPLKTKETPLSALPGITDPEKEITVGGTLVYDESGNLGVVDAYTVGDNFVTVKTLVNSETSYLKVDETSTTIGPHELVRAVGATTDVILADLLEYSEEDATWVPVQKSDLVKGKTLVFDIRGTLGIFDSFQNSEQYARIRTVTVSDGTQALIKRSGSRLLPFIIGSETSWLVSDLFPSVDSIVVGSTLICDDLGTMGVVNSVDTGSIPETMTIMTVSRTLTHNFGRLNNTILNTNIGGVTDDIPSSDIIDLFNPGEYGSSFEGSVFYVYDKFGTVAKLTAILSNSPRTYRAQTITNSGANSGITSYWGTEYFDLKVGARTDLTKIDIENHSNINWTAFQSGKILIHDNLGTIGIVHRDVSDPTLFYIETINHCYTAGPYRVNSVSLAGKIDATTEVQYISGLAPKFYVPNKTIVYDEDGTLAVLTNYDSTTGIYTAKTYSVGSARSWFLYSGTAYQSKWNLTPFVTTSVFGLSEVTGVKDNRALKGEELAITLSGTLLPIFIVDNDGNVWAATGPGSATNTVNVMCIETSNRAVEYLKVKNNITFGLSLGDQTTFTTDDIIGTGLKPSDWVKDHTIFYDGNGSVAILRDCIETASVATYRLTVETITTGSSMLVFYYPGVFDNLKGEGEEYVVTDTITISYDNLQTITGSALADETNVLPGRTLFTDIRGELALVTTVDATNHECDVIPIAHVKEWKVVKLNVALPTRVGDYLRIFAPNHIIKLMDSQMDGVADADPGDLTPYRCLVWDGQGTVGLLIGNEYDGSDTDTYYLRIVTISEASIRIFKYSSEINSSVNSETVSWNNLTELYTDHTGVTGAMPKKGDLVIDPKGRISIVSSFNMATQEATIDHYLKNLLGATASAAGREGIVPRPLAGDQLKFLRGDATWQFQNTLVTDKDLIPSADTPNAWNTIVESQYPKTGEFGESKVYFTHYDTAGRFTNQPTRYGELVTIINRWSGSTQPWVTQFWCWVSNSEPIRYRHGQGDTWAYPDTTGGWQSVSGSQLWRTTDQITAAQDSTVTIAITTFTDPTGRNTPNKAVIGDIVIDPNMRMGQITAISGTDVTVKTLQSFMVGATRYTDGKGGLVPTPLAEEEYKFLCADGAWQWTNALETNPNFRPDADEPGDFYTDFSARYPDIKGSRIFLTRFTIPDKFDHQPTETGDMISHTYIDEDDNVWMLQLWYDTSNTSLGLVYRYGYNYTWTYPGNGEWQSVGAGSQIWRTSAPILALQDYTTTVPANSLTDPTGRITYSRAGVGDLVIDGDGKSGVITAISSGYVTVQTLQAAMVGANASVNGAGGLVPRPVAGKQDAYLRGNATWQVPGTNLKNSDRKILTSEEEVMKYAFTLFSNTTDIPNIPANADYDTYLEVGKYFNYNTTTTSHTPTTAHHILFVTNVQYDDLTPIAATYKVREQFVLVPNGEVYTRRASTGGTTTWIWGDWRRLDYHTMTGSTASADGAEGGVPKPLAGYNRTYLRADGTWNEAGVDWRINQEFSETRRLYTCTVNLSNLQNWGSMSATQDTIEKGELVIDKNGTIGQVADPITSTTATILILGTKFTGATSSADGLGGNVPKPVAGDQTKFLRGDATWQELPAGYKIWRDISGTRSTTTFGSTINNISIANQRDESGNTATATTLHVGDMVYDNNGVGVQVTSIGTTTFNAIVTDERMKGATASVAGKGGSTPPSSAGDQNKALSGAGTWQEYVQYSSTLGTGNNVGSATVPVYVNNGTVTPVNVAASGSYKSCVPSLTSSGVMEIGKYLDFHETGSTRDYDLRLYSNGDGYLRTTDGTGNGRTGYVPVSANTSLGSATQGIYLENGVLKATTGGSSHLYMHTYGYGTTSVMHTTWKLFLTDNTVRTRAQVAKWLYDNGFINAANAYEASGIVDWFTVYVATSSGGSPTQSYTLTYNTKGVYSTDGTNIRVLASGGTNYWSVSSDATSSGWGFVKGPVVQLF